MITLARITAMLPILASFLACGGGGGGQSSASSEPPAHSSLVGRFAFMANFNDNSVSCYTVNPRTGQLRHNGYYPAGAQPYALAVHPSGQFVYVSNYGAGVSGYSVETDGSLTKLFDHAGSISSQPRGISIDPSGKFLYAAYSHPSANYVEAYAITSDGSLSYISDDFSVARPFSITVDPTGKFAYITGFDGGTISGFAIQSNGSLSAIDTDGSTSGAQPAISTLGTGAHAFILSPNGKFGYAANFNSDLVAAYAVDTSTGALTPLDADSTTPGVQGYSSGANPRSLAMDPAGRVLFCANYGGNTISGWSINSSTGALTRMTGSPFYAGYYPGTVKVDPTGSFLYTTNEGSSDSTIFPLDANGIPGNPTTVAGRNGCLDLAMSVGDKAVVYTPKAAYSANISGQSISRYAIASNGTLSALGNSPTTPLAGPVALATDPSARFLYAAGDSTVGQFSLDSAGALTALNPASVSLPSGWANMVALDPMGKFAYVPNQLDSRVHQFTVGTNGALSPMSTPFVSSGTQSAFAAIDPTGRFLYTANAAGGVSQFSITSGGGLSPLSPASVPSGIRPTAMAIHPSGRFAYVTSAASQEHSIYSYLIDIDGKLSSLGPATPSGMDPVSVAVDPSGRFLYTANNYDNSISQFSIASNGVLTPLSQPTVTTGLSYPSGVSVDPSGKFVYVASRFSNAIFQFSIGTDGALTPLSTASAPADSEPITVVTTASIH